MVACPASHTRRSTVDTVQPDGRAAGAPDAAVPGSLSSERPNHEVVAPVAKRTPNNPTNAAITVGSFKPSQPIGGGPPLDRETLRILGPFVLAHSLRSVASEPPYSLVRPARHCCRGLRTEEPGTRTLIGRLKTTLRTALNVAASAS